MFLLLCSPILLLGGLVMYTCAKDRETKVASVQKSPKTRKGSESDTKSSSRTTTLSEQGKNSSTPKPPATVPGAPTPNAQQQEKKVEAGAIDKSFPPIEYLLRSEATIGSKWLEQVALVVDRVIFYQWVMKKRLAADENSWKELNKKIEKFKAEGFCVKPGSEEAKKMRKQGAAGPSRVSAVMKKNREAAKDKK